MEAKAFDTITPDPGLFIWSILILLGTLFLIFLFGYFTYTLWNINRFIKNKSQEK